jgi:hypothetical protein
MTEATERLCHEIARAVCEVDSDDKSYFLCKWPTCDCRVKERISRLDMLFLEFAEAVKMSAKLGPHQS